VASGGVIDRGEQDVYVAVVDAGDGVAQADGCRSARLAARQSILRSPAEHGRPPACRASMAASQSIAAVRAPWWMKRPKSLVRASHVPWAMISPVAASSA
jgi:hypothetical protein